jgi:hypothetical protein
MGQRVMRDHMHLTKFATQISFEHSYDTHDLGVSATLDPDRFDGLKQGDAVGSQRIFQFYTGEGFDHFVIMLDWEDWGDERCPRFALYRATQVQDGRFYELAADVTTEPRYPTK